VEISLIAIPKNPVGQNSSVESQRKLVEEIRARAAAGADFGAEANGFSQGRRTTNGGYCGWLGRSLLRKELADAAFALQPGQVSKVIETEDNFFLVRVAGFRPAAFRP